MSGATISCAAGLATLTVVVSPTSATNTASTSTITTGTVTATPSNGTAPFSYVWITASQTGSLNVALTAGTSATTAFRISGAASLDNGVCTATCQVTDTNGIQGVSNVVSVTITHT